MASLRRSSRSKKSQLPLFPLGNSPPSQSEFRARYESQWTLECRKEYLNQWAQRESRSMSPPKGSMMGPRSSNMCNAPNPTLPGVRCRAIPATHAPPCWGARLLPDGTTEVRYWTDAGRVRTVKGHVTLTESPRKPIPDLPVEKRSIPIIAWKGARLSVDKAGKEIGLYSGPVSKHGKHQIIAEAKCVFANHEAPAVVCGSSATAGCGFYGVMNAGDVLLAYNDVLLEVELSGRVIVHESGYRAGKQRILAVEIPMDGCDGFLCLEPPTQVHFPIDGVMRAVCDQHAPANGRIATLDLIAEHLGVDVRFAREE